MNKILNKRTWFVLGAVSLLLMGGFYVYQVNDLVQGVYLRDQHQEHLVNLQEEIKRSEVAVSQNQSLTRVDEMIGERGFEAVNNIEYVQVSVSQVAAAR